MPDEREFIKLEMRVEDLKERHVKMESDLKEMFGLIKELSGKVSVSLQFDQINDQLEEVRRDNTAQSREIGELAGLIKGVIDALAKSSDRSVAAAAQGLTINVAASGGASNVTNSVNVGDQNHHTNNIRGDNARIAQGGQVDQS